MNNNFSPAVKEVLSISREEAIRLESNYIGTGHLTLALLKKTGDTLAAISGSGHSIPELIKEIESSIRNKKETTEPGTGKVIGKSKFRLFKLSAPRPAGLRLDRQAEKAIRESVVQAKYANSAIVEPEHLILAILKDRQDVVSKLW